MEHQKAKDVVRFGVVSTPARQWATDLKGLLARADAAFAEHRLADAKRDLQEALQLCPDSPEILSGLGGLLYQLDEFRESRSILQRLVAQKPNEPSAWVQLALANYRLGILTEFETALLQALEIEPQHRTALKLLADHLAENHQFVDASKIYLQILNSHPKDLDVLLALAACFYRMEDTACARMMFEQVLQIQPENGLAKEGLDIIRRGIRPKAQVVKKPEPLVSAIVSTYNSERFLRRCLEDLERQTIADRLEIIVVNSGSQENEQSIVEDFQRRFANIVYLHTPERETVYAAWNRAIRVARGNYITNANTDDRHTPDALEKMAYALSQRPEVGLVYADSEVHRSENADWSNAAVVGRLRWPDFRRELLFQVCCIGPQPMWRKSLHDEFGYFDSTLTVAGDYEFWLRISSRTQFLHLTEVLGLYLEAPRSVAHQNSDKCSHESERARERHWPTERGPRPRPQGCFLERYPAPRPSSMVESTKGRPAVSVIMPTCNRPLMLQEAIESVLEQTFQDFELLVINDGGEDVAPLLMKLNQKGKIRYAQHSSHRGPSAARNTGISHARGKYVAYLDDDDLYLPGHLQTLVGYLEQSGSKIAYTDGYRAQQEVHGNHYVITGRDVPYSQNFDRDLILVGNFVPILRLMHQRVCLAETGGFDESLPAVEDWDLWIRLSRYNHPAHISEITCEFRTRKREAKVLIQSLTNLLAGTDAVYRKYEHWVADKPLVRAWQLKNREDAFQKLRKASEAS
ncbi:MAG: glycosyltransferase [Pedosphaera sp.]|nr:glycosyltransferase [Pedosphaera sp.]